MRTSWPKLASQEFSVLWVCLLLSRDISDSIWFKHIYSNKFYIYSYNTDNK